MPATVHRTVADGMTKFGLPGKMGNANTKPPQKCGGSFYACNSPPDCYGRHDNTWPTRKDR